MSLPALAGTSTQEQAAIRAALLLWVEARLTEQDLPENLRRLATSNGAHPALGTEGIRALLDKLATPS